MRTLLISILAAIGPAGAVVAQNPPPKVAVNTDKGLALSGYDPVSYFMESVPIKGDPAITASYLGATYRFATKENRDSFTGEPAKYAPQFGGFCGYGVSAGHLVGVDPLAYTIMNGRLILQHTKGVLEQWKKDPEGRLKLADENWPKLVEKEGKPLP